MIEKVLNTRSRVVVSPMDAKQAEIDRLQEQVRQLLEALAPSTVMVPPEWGLTATQMRVFAHMTTRDLVSRNSLMIALYGSRPHDHPNEEIISVFVAKIRRKLEPYGVRIKTVWGQGFSLVDRRKYVASREAA